MRTPDGRLHRPLRPGAPRRVPGPSVPLPVRRQADINEEIGLSLTRHLVYEHGSPSIYLRRLRSIKTLQSVHRKFHKGDSRPLR